MFLSTDFKFTSTQSDSFKYISNGVIQDDGFSMDVALINHKSTKSCLSEGIHLSWNAGDSIPSAIQLLFNFTSTKLRITEMNGFKYTLLDSLKNSDTLDLEVSQRLGEICPKASIGKDSSFQLTIKSDKSYLLIYNNLYTDGCIDLSPRSEMILETVSSSITPSYGFHSKIIFTPPQHSNSRRKLLSYLTNSFFVDPFELGRITWSGLNVSVHGSVDLESPAYSQESKPHFLSVDLNTLSEVEIPFHVRYQAPSPSEVYRAVRFESPCLLSISPEVCTEKEILPSAIGNLLGLPTNQGCITYQSLESVVFQIPVGNSSTAQIVSYQTFAISIFGVILVMLSFMRSKRKLNKQD